MKGFVQDIESIAVNKEEFRPVLYKDEIGAEPRTLDQFVNTGSVPLKLYTIYAPPSHRGNVRCRIRTSLTSQ